jgi:hypothetical protein
VSLENDVGVATKATKVCFLEAPAWRSVFAITLFVDLNYNPRTQQGPQMLSNHHLLSTGNNHCNDSFHDPK